jgi:hypothetical protein
MWSTAFFGWGVGRTALNAVNYFGTTCNSATRDTRVRMLTDNLVERRTEYLSSFDRMIFLLDNYCWGKASKSYH